MAEVEIFRRTNTIIAHHPEMRGFLKGRADIIATVARVLLDTRSEVRTGASYINTSSGKLDAYVELIDRNYDGSSDGDNTAAMISFQHNILWDAIKMSMW